MVIVRLGGGTGGPSVKQIKGLTAVVGMSEPGQIVCKWTLPADNNYIGVMIRYKEDDYPQSLEDGFLAYSSNTTSTDNNTTCMISGLTDGTQYFIRAFAYTVIGTKKVYNTTKTEDCCATATPYQIQGQIIVTSSGPVTLPYGVNTIDVFAVGGGGGAACGEAGTGGPTTTYGGGGAGGGYVSTKLGVKVGVGATLQAVIGAGGVGGIAFKVVQTAGGETALYKDDVAIITAAGGGVSNAWHGGGGGSGGGVAVSNAGPNNSPRVRGGNGGSDGADGGQSWNITSNTIYQNGEVGGKGSGQTTRAFAEAAGTKYGGGGGAGGASHNNPTAGFWNVGGSGMDGGGGGGYISNGGTGTPNTGGGGGGGSPSGYRSDTGSSPRYYNGGGGGSGVIIIRWGY